MRGLAQYFFTPDYRSVTHSWLGGKTVSVAGIFLPVPQLARRAGARSPPSARSISSSTALISAARWRRPARIAGAVALVGIDKNRVFALGWGLGAALVGLSGADHGDVLLHLS